MYIMRMDILAFLYPPVHLHPRWSAFPMCFACYTHGNLLHFCLIFSFLSSYFPFFTIFMSVCDFTLFLYCVSLCVSSFCLVCRSWNDFSHFHSKERWGTNILFFTPKNDLTSWWLHVWHILLFFFLTIKWKKEEGKRNKKKFQALLFDLFLK